MALIDCPECESEVSDRAGSCPHCGYQINRTKRAEDSYLTRNRGCGDILIFGPILLIVFILMAAMCSGC